MSSHVGRQSDPSRDREVALEFHVTPAEMAELRQCARGVRPYIRTQRGRDSMDLIMMLAEEQMFQTQMRREGAEIERRSSRRDLRDRVKTVVDTKEDMGKSMTKFAIIGGLITMLGAATPHIPMGVTMNPYRDTIAEGLKTAGKGFDSYNQVSNVYADATVYGNQMSADIAKQDVETALGAREEARGINRTQQDEVRGMWDRFTSLFQKLWTS